MKTFTVDYPVVGWASATIEVDENMDEYDVIDAIRDGDIEIVFDPAQVQTLTPVLSLREFIRDDNSEIPIEAVAQEG